ncbi:hypothetical protein GJ496_008035 [Pomphorhynchus laevis]|nr:hypothetical protein GJ496_008035 [Pomphorhynchus laevis]
MTEPCRHEQVPVKSTNSADSKTLQNQMQTTMPAEENPPAALSKRYNQLLQLINEMGRDVKSNYSGNKAAADRLKRNIIAARSIIRDCQIECDRINRL